MLFQSGIYGKNGVRFLCIFHFGMSLERTPVLELEINATSLVVNAPGLPHSR
jgi:hypothetical protein